MDSVTVIAAFTSGLLTFFAPCTFVSLPAFISYISVETFSGNEDKKALKKRVFLSALAYSFGFIIVFTLLGLTATALGHTLVKNKETLQRVGGFLMILAGLFLLFGDRMKILRKSFTSKQIDTSSVKKNSLTFPLIIGITSAFAWTPCVGPVLGSILFLAGASSESPIQGGLLLFIHSLGITIPFLALSLVFERAISLINKLSKYTGLLHKISGNLIIFFGAALLIGFYSDLSGVIHRIFMTFGYNPG